MIEDGDEVFEAFFGAWEKGVELGKIKADRPEQDGFAQGDFLRVEWIITGDAADGDHWSEGIRDMRLGERGVEGDEVENGKKRST